jgi:ABC-type uncharacterized transport system permease subunit
MLETAKLVVVLGILASVVAVGLAFAWSKVFGGVVTSDEIVRYIILSFVVAATTMAIMRRRPPRKP